MSDRNRRYVLITPCRDEAAYLPVTIRTVAGQSVLPALWVIVDDGSTDATPDILAEAARQHDFIRVVRRDDRGKRMVGPGVIDAFYAGLRTVSLDDFKYLCKLDGDLELPPQYFERLMEEMEAEPVLGNVSGKTYLRRENGEVVSERFGNENAVGPSKFYRVKCFQDIGGFVREVGWDGIDGHMCRMNGWMARSIDDPELRLIHLRQMGSSYRGLWTGRLRWGYGKWYMGSSLEFVLAVAVYRCLERPYLVTSLGILLGYLRAMLARKPRYDNRGFRRYLRRYERSALLRGKNRVTEEYHARIRAQYDLERVVPAHQAAT
ncbi:MAG: glycosyltransferase family 2 protein [bacterium]|nr:glycosyltransferase family 2 protein [bacterium]